MKDGQFGTHTKSGQNGVREIGDLCLDEILKKASNLISPDREAGREEA